MNAMNASKQPNTPAVPAEVARTAQTVAPVIRVRSPSAGNDPAVAETQRNEAEAWAKHAASANGFGDAGAIELYREARAHRAAVLGAMFAAVSDAVRTLARGAYARYRRYRDAQETYETLSGLDDRALRDLGMHRDEIWSVAAETTGLAERTRVRVVPVSYNALELTDARIRR
jgi:uncharacterized protein YjiS (DUF1127 family)